MKNSLVALISGFIFSIGLGVSGMTQPQKILGFLDFLGNWDPSLIFVMGGAVGLHLITYKLIRLRSKPVLDQQWHIPQHNKINKRLIFGSMLFGAGWGIAGYCPGPALTSLASGNSQAIIFVIAMILGMILFKRVDKKLSF